MRLIGQVGGERLRIVSEGLEQLDEPVEALEAVHREGLTEFFR